MFSKEDIPEELRHFRSLLKRGAIRRSKKVAGCCGYEAIFGFENIPLAYFQRFKKEAVEWLSSDPGISPRAACIVTTLANFQIVVLEPILMESGYRKTSEGRNHKTNNRVVMYTKILHGV